MWCVAADAKASDAGALDGKPCARTLCFCCLAVANFVPSFHAVSLEMGEVLWLLCRAPLNILLLLPFHLM